MLYYNLYFTVNDGKTFIYKIIQCQYSGLSNLLLKLKL